MHHLGHFIFLAQIEPEIVLWSNHLERHVHQADQVQGTEFARQTLEPINGREEVMVILSGRLVLQLAERFDGRLGSDCNHPADEHTSCRAGGTTSSNRHRSGWKSELPQ